MPCPCKPNLARDTKNDMMKVGLSVGVFLTGVRYLQVQPPDLINPWMVLASLTVMQVHNLAKLLPFEDVMGSYEDDILVAMIGALCYPYSIYGGNPSVLAEHLPDVALGAFVAMLTYKLTKVFIDYAKKPSDNKLN